ncbi:large subunit ribosomal protein L27e [Nematocida displodere]|uniref:Large subunit ribosomal protein L27e n=1 Tax=Nematocida displodere TaxID=1805483 RepID=A0A177EIS4_9MICR|nr:large subunit ribosomal protein L27e [Nematocida displodere]
MFSKEEVVLITKGRYAGIKAVIIEDLEEKDGRMVVTIVGLEKIPKPVTEDMTEMQKSRQKYIKAFIKKMNVRHLIATRYTMENVFDKVAVRDISDISEKTEMRKDVEKLFRTAYQNNPTHWIFKKQKV